MGGCERRSGGWNDNAGVEERRGRGKSTRSGDEGGSVRNRGESRQSVLQRSWRLTEELLLECCERVRAGFEAARAGCCGPFVDRSRWRERASAVRQRPGALTQRYREQRRQVAEDARLSPCAQLVSCGRESEARRRGRIASIARIEVLTEALSAADLARKKEAMHSQRRETRCNADRMREKGTARGQARLFLQSTTTSCGPPARQPPSPPPSPFPHLSTSAHKVRAKHFHLLAALLVARTARRFHSKSQRIPLHQREAREVETHSGFSLRSTRCCRCNSRRSGRDGCRKCMKLQRAGSAPNRARNVGRDGEEDRRG